MTTTLESVSEDATGFYCHFTAEFFQQAAFKVDLSNDFPFFQLTADPLIKISNSTRTEQLLQILFEENAQNDKKRIPFIQIYLLALLSEIKYLSETQSYEKKVKNAATYLTERYQNALSTRIYDKTSIVEFAEYLNVTPNHLHKCVKAVTGKSAHDLLADMRILESKVLLKQSNLSIGEIAYRIGKFDQSDFARFFKSKTNLTPNQYRQGTN
jgi:AraC-like DNA-binding protein